MRVNINSKDPQFLKEIQQLNLPRGITTGPSGFVDLAVSGGRYLAVTAPKERATRIGFAAREKGDVFVIDLVAMEKAWEQQVKDSQGADRTLRVQDADVKLIDFNTSGKPRTGQVPYYISAGSEAGQFVVSSPGAYNQGFAAFTAKRDENGAWSDAKVGAPWLKPAQSDWWNGTKFRQNIEHAVGVVVSADGKYAFVADYELIFDEPGFMDGALVYKQVGGKIGIIKDPFTNPVFLGATTPIEGASLDNLSLSADGSTLLATAMVEEYGGPGDGYYSRMFSTVFQFNATGLIQAAEALGSDKRKPIDGSNTALLPRRYDELPKSWAVATLASSGALDLISPKLNADARPVFELKATHAVTNIELYVSSFAPGEGLFPNDSPKLPDWHGGNKTINGPEHDQRILTLTDAANGRTFAPGEVIRLEDFANDPRFVDFKLTAGQTYYWGVKVTLASGLELTGSQQFTVKRAWEQPGYTGSSVTILTHGYQPPMVSGSDGASSGLINWALPKTDPTGSGVAELGRTLAKDQGGYAYVYDKKSGKWRDLDTAENGGTGAAQPSMESALMSGKPVVLIPDWVLESGWSDSGFSEAAADAVYASLLDANSRSGGRLLSGNVHVLGHSRGTVVLRARPAHPVGRPRQRGAAPRRSADHDAGSARLHPALVDAGRGAVAPDGQCRSRQLHLADRLGTEPDQRAGRQGDRGLAGLQRAAGQDRLEQRHREGFAGVAGRGAVDEAAERRQGGVRLDPDRRRDQPQPGPAGSQGHRLLGLLRPLGASLGRRGLCRQLLPARRRREGRSGQDGDPQWPLAGRCAEGVRGQRLRLRLRPDRAQGLHHRRPVAGAGLQGRNALPPAHLVRGHLELAVQLLQHDADQVQGR
jgi:hypothetical protein